MHKQFGDAAAILIGDLALVWNEQAIHQSGMQTELLNNIHDIMRTELMAGQFLDVYEQTQKTFSVERSLKIARYKSGKYSIERPLHYGAALTNTKNIDTYFRYLFGIRTAFGRSVSITR
jgi:geranylgeranyl diphosphate synthase type I